MKRWEIGEIASRIGQLYFGQYMRTSEASYLSESYIFYEAILTREYFKEGLYQDINLASKQLRFLARFLTVCLVFNRREVVYQLVNELKMLLDECKRTFQVLFMSHMFISLYKCTHACVSDSVHLYKYHICCTHTCSHVYLYILLGRICIYYMDVLVFQICVGFIRYC